MTWLQGEEHVGEMEHFLRQHIGPACEADQCMEIDDIIDDLAACEAVALVVHDDSAREIYGVCVVQGRDYPKHRALEVLTAVGHDIDEWLPIITSTLVRYADQLGCDIVRCYTRPGLAAKLHRLDVPEGRWRRKLELVELERGPVDG